MNDKTTIEALAKRMAFAARERNDLSEDATEFWVCTSDAAKDKWMKVAAAVDDLEARIEQLEEENEKLRKGLEIYQRERDRFRHANPEMTGAYFLAGGHGGKDENKLPHFVEVVPAYGCGWSMVYETTDRTISYEGS